jgi:hypothetical protein
MGLPGQTFIQSGAKELQRLEMLLASLTALLLLKRGCFLLVLVSRLLVLLMVVQTKITIQIKYK